jgi:signal transduction histidine kinase
MFDILNTYRSGESEREIAGRVATYLKSDLNCEAVSIFTYNGATRFLTLLYTTSLKIKDVAKHFDEETSVYRMMLGDKDRIISHEEIKDKFPHADTFFEDVAKVHSLAFALSRDCYNRVIAVLRVINKKRKNGDLVSFSTSDLDKIIAAANILGMSFVSRYSHQRAISFLDSVTHELLAPMSGVKNTTAFLRGYIRKTDESHDEQKTRILSNLEDIMGSADTSISLVQGITMFSRSGRMSKQDLEIKPNHLFTDVIAKSIGSVSSLIATRKFDRNRIRCIDKHRWPLLKIDRKIMKQVFSNLLNNSVKYAYDNPDHFFVDIFLEELPNGDILIKIEDHGIGIEPEASKRIFLPGERGQNAKERVPTGTGIGLTTVNNLLHLQGMEIDLEIFSRPTQFSIRVPAEFVIRSKR